MPREPLTGRRHLQPRGLRDGVRLVFPVLPRPGRALAPARECRGRACGHLDGPEGSPSPESSRSYARRPALPAGAVEVGLRCAQAVGSAQGIPARQAPGLQVGTDPLTRRTGPRRWPCDLFHVKRCSDARAVRPCGASATRHFPTTLAADAHDCTDGSARCRRLAQRGPVPRARARAQAAGPHRR